MRKKGQRKRKSGARVPKRKRGSLRNLPKNLNKRWGATMLYILEVTQNIVGKIFERKKFILILRLNMKQCVKLVELSQVSILLRGLCGKRNDEHAGLDWIGLTVGYWYLHYSKDCSRA